jgi:lysophospholipase L1-like esterase
MRVLVFGASSAQGYWDIEGGWADRLKKYYDQMQIRDFSVDLPAIMNLGVSGNTAADILRRVGPEAKARQNEKGLAIIIQVGTNNAAEQNGQLHSTIEDYQKELEAIIEKAKNFTDKVLIVGFPAVDESKTNPIAWSNIYFKNENILKFENAAKNCAEEAGVNFVEIHKEFLNRDVTKLQAQDGLHPNDEGHKLIFELVRPRLDELLQ